MIQRAEYEGMNVYTIPGKGSIGLPQRISMGSYETLGHVDIYNYPPQKNLLRDERTHESIVKEIQRRWGEEREIFYAPTKKTRATRHAVIRLLEKKVE